MALHPDITRKDDASLALDVANTAGALASRQQTRNAGSITIPNADGTSTVLGVQAGDTTVARFVGDTTAPGTPTGVTANSAASMIFILWDGTLDGGVPPDFHHVALLVDGVEVAELAGRGSYACGPYDNGSEHTVTAISYDDAHDATGESTPNRSAPSTAITVTIQGSDIDPSALGITVTKTATAPTDTDKGTNRGDLWLQYDRDPTATGTTLTAEWWWTGTAWDPIPVAVYLDQLAARGVTADNAVIGLLSAGIIQSGTFRTAETGARVEIDANGITAYDANGDRTVSIPSDGTPLFVGGVQTGKDDSARFRMSQSSGTSPKGDAIASTGVIDFYPQNATSPAMRIMGYDDGTTKGVSLGLPGSSAYMDISDQTTSAGEKTSVALQANSLLLMQEDSGGDIEIDPDVIRLTGPAINMTGNDTVAIGGGKIDVETPGGAQIELVDNTVSLYGTKITANNIDVTSKDWARITPPASGATPIGDVLYCVRGGVVHLRGRVKTTTPDAVVWNIPAGCQPRTVSGGSNFMSFFIDANGPARAYVALDAMQLHIQTAADFNDISSVSWPIA